MKKYLPVLVLLGAGMAIGVPSAMAADAAHSAPAKAVKKVQKKAAPAKAAEEDKEPDLAGHSRTDYNCELGNKISVYEKDSDDQHIGLRWNRKMHELTRVSTTTGANRFEDKQSGLVWINIPAKGMLLDSKKGQQLANECKSHMQMKVRKSST